MYTSVARLAFESILALIAPYLQIVIWTAVLATIFGTTSVLDRVLGDVGRALHHLLSAVMAGVLRALLVFFPWSVKACRAAALHLLRPTTPGQRTLRWKVDLLGWALTLLLWALAYLVLFYPWVPSSAAGGWPPAAPAGAPGAPPAPAGSASVRLAGYLVDQLNRALSRGMGGINIRPGRYSKADVDDALDILNDPARAVAAGLPTDVRVRPSDRLDGFLQVTPSGGASGPIQDIL